MPKRKVKSKKSLRKAKKTKGKTKPKSKTKRALKKRPNSTSQSAKAKKVRPKGQSTKPDAAVPKGQLIGKITHYFPHVNAAVLVVKKGNLKIGDSVLVKGHTTQFKQRIESMQIDRVPIVEAKKGDEIGLLVGERVREHDVVYKIA